MDKSKTGNNNDKNTLTRMPDCQELRKRAKSNKLIITEDEKNILRLSLGDYMRLKNNYIGENSKFYPTELLLALRKVSDYGLSSNDEEIRNAANLAAEFVKNPSGIIQASFYKEMRDAEKDCEDMLTSLSRACSDAFYIDRNNIAEYAADELMSLVSLFKNGDSVEIVFNYLDKGLKKLSDAAREWQKFGKKSGRIKTPSGSVSMVEAAELCDVSPQTIRNWESGKTTKPYGYPSRDNRVSFIGWAKGFNRRTPKKIKTVSYQANKESHNRTQKEDNDGGYDSFF